MSTHPPVDLDEFRTGLRAAGIEEIFEPMLELFVSEAQKGMGYLASAVAAGDLDAIERTAHSLKSSAGNVRAKAMTALLQEVETAAAQGDLETAAGVFEGVRAEYAAVARYLAGRPGAT